MAVPYEGFCQDERLGCVLCVFSSFLDAVSVWLSALDSCLLAFGMIDIV